MSMTATTAAELFAACAGAFPAAVRAVTIAGRTYAALRTDAAATAQEGTGGHGNAMQGAYVLLNTGIAFDPRAIVELTDAGRRYRIDGHEYDGAGLTLTIRIAEELL